jgi:hypothetical protein
MAVCLANKKTEKVLVIKKQALSLQCQVETIIAPPRN